MWPTRRLPFSAIATIDGVVLYPPRLGITEGVPSSTIATHEFVVPRSMPITLSLAIASLVSPGFSCDCQLLRLRNGPNVRTQTHRARSLCAGLQLSSHVGEIV